MHVNAKQIWQTTIERLQTKVQPAVFTTWFQGTSALSFEDGIFVVRVPTTFAKAHLEGRFIDLIRSILAEITGSPVEIRFVVAKDDQSTNGNEVPSSAGKRSYRAPKGRGQGQVQPHGEGPQGVPLAGTQPAKEGPTWSATLESPMSLHSTGVDAHPVAHHS